MEKKKKRFLCKVGIHSWVYFTNDILDDFYLRYCEHCLKEQMARSFECKFVTVGEHDFDNCFDSDTKEN